jgi:hypothetical protein
MGLSMLNFQSFLASKRKQRVVLKFEQHENEQGRSLPPFLLLGKAQ